MVKIALLTLLLFPSCLFAAVPNWSIDSSNSRLSFTATQNDAPAGGQFRHFSGDIAFDPKQLTESHVSIIVDMSSVSTIYEILEETLRSSEWFDSKQFPNATFTAKAFKHIADNQYEAKGTLTLRDKTSPITLIFKWVDINATAAHVSGKTTIKRLNFGVGQGEWSNDTGVSNPVIVEFDIQVKRATSH